MRHVTGTPGADAGDSALRAAMEGSPDAFFILARHGEEFRISDANSSAGRLLQTDRDALIGRNIGDFSATPESRALFQDVFVRVHESGRPFEGEYELQAGAMRWVHYQVVPLPGGVAITTRDISGRKLSEEALRQSEQRFQTLVQHMPGVVFTLSQHEDKPAQFRFDFLSDSIEELTGRPASAFFGDERLSLEDLLAPEDRDAVARADACFAAGKSADLDFRIVHSDGSVRWLSLRGAPELDGHGRIVVRGVMLDVHARKQLEEQFLVTQKLDAVGRLAGGVAHDLNNVLLVIRGYSHVLMAMLDDDTGRDEVKEIENAAERASQLVQQLLAFGRTQVVQSAECDLNTLVHEQRRVLASLAGDEVELQVAVEPGLRAVTADGAQLEQALVELVVNARDAMPTGGRLLLTTRGVTVGEHAPHPSLPPGRYGALSVQDTGAGMDSVTKARVFEPFFSTKDGRAGLGLSSVYGLVKQIGGDVTVASAPGEGTTFTVLLPLAQAAAPARRPTASAADPSETVLLVDDDDNARELVGRLLRESGYRVIDAALPEHALDRCGEYDGPIHLLLSDVVMPQMSGPMLAKEIVARRPDTRVLFISGYIEQPEDVEIVSDGDAFLQKPFTPSELFQTIRRVLDVPEGVGA